MDNRKIVVFLDKGKRKVMKVHDKIIFVQQLDRAGIGFADTWNEFNDAMKDTANHGKLYFVEDSLGVDDLNPGESCFAFIINGSSYEIVRTWEGIYAWVLKKLEEQDIALRQEIDINTEDIYSLEQLFAQMQDALNNIENIWKGDQHFNMVGDDAQYDLSTLKTDGVIGGDKGPFDFTAGKRIYIQLTNGDVHKVYDLKIGANPVQEIMGRATFKLKVDAVTGLLHITDFVGNGKTITDTTITELEQSKAISISSPEDLIDFSENIIFNTTAAATVGLISYKESTEHLIRTQVEVDKITIPGVEDLMTYRTPFDIKARVQESNTNFGSAIELNGESVIYTNPIDPSNPGEKAKSFKFSGNPGDAYKVELINKKLVLTAIGATIITVNDVVVTLTDKKYTIDNPSEYWNTNGLMRIAIAAPEGSIKDGTKLLTLTSKIHPHLLKTYSWQTMKVLEGEYTEDIYSIETKSIASGTTMEVKITKNGTTEVVKQNVRLNTTETLTWDAKGGKVIDANMVAYRTVSYNNTDKSHITVNRRNANGWEIENGLPSIYNTGKINWKFNDDGKLVITAGTYIDSNLLQGTFTVRKRKTNVVDTPAVTKPVNIIQMINTSNQTYHLNKSIKPGDQIRFLESLGIHAEGTNDIDHPQNGEYKEIKVPNNYVANVEFPFVSNFYFIQSIDALAGPNFSPEDNGPVFGGVVRMKIKLFNSDNTITNEFDRVQIIQIQMWDTYNAYEAKIKKTGSPDVSLGWTTGTAANTPQWELIGRRTWIKEVYILD